MSKENEQEISRDASEGIEKSDARPDEEVSEETDGLSDEVVPERGDRVDSAAGSFLEVEQALDGMVEGMQVRGQAIDVERIPAHEVPDGFPYEIATSDALALTLEIDQTEGKTVTTYFGWPGDGADERLGKLLRLREVPVDRFADLHGDSILLEVENGHFVPVLPKDEQRGDDRAYWGILAGLFPSILIAVAGVLNAGAFLFTSTFLFVWLLATFVILPLATYYDAWNLRTTTNWNGGPLFWATLAMIPGLNVMTTAAYLIIRKNAESII